MTDEYFHKTTNVNFSGVFYCAREAGKVFKKQGSGSFIITASMSGHIVNVPNTQAVYNAHSLLEYRCGRWPVLIDSRLIAEAGVIHLGKSLAFEWKDFARVNIISPGFVDTNSKF
jgi:sorbose reductase